MELLTEIDSLLDAIEREILLLDQVTKRMSIDLDTQATQDMTRWLEEWKPFDGLEQMDISRP